MDYEKKYNDAMARCELIARTGLKFNPEYIFPELRESEDERMIRVIGLALTDVPEERFTSLGTTLKDCLAYLEKQKENPKSADSIPSNCASDAKCEDRWHKVEDFLPDTGRDVLAKDALGNYLLASFDGAQWFVSVYDGEDHPVLHTPPILEWCEIPSEKQKEQNPADLSKMMVHKEPCVAPVPTPIVANEQKPAEWSEEDERIVSGIATILEAWDRSHTAPGGIPSLIPEYCLWLDNRLKSLRPSWKPSEEQMEALEYVIRDYREDSCNATANYLQAILDNLKNM